MISHLKSCCIYHRRCWAWVLKMLLSPSRGYTSPQTLSSSSHSLLNTSSMSMMPSSSKHRRFFNTVSGSGGIWLTNSPVSSAMHWLAFWSPVFQLCGCGLFAETQRVLCVLVPVCLLQFILWLTDQLSSWTEVFPSAAWAFIAKAGEAIRSFALTLLYTSEVPYSQRLVAHVSDTTPQGVLLIPMPGGVPDTLRQNVAPCHVKSSKLKEFEDWLSNLALKQVIEPSCKRGPPCTQSRGQGRIRTNRPDEPPPVYYT